MTAKTDGGPAFPFEQCAGMTLRDWFAGQIAPALFMPMFELYRARDLFNKEGGTITRAEEFEKMFVAGAYKFADLMLAQREKEGDDE